MREEAQHRSPLPASCEQLQLCHMEKASRIGKEGGGRREKSGVRQEVSKQERPYKAKGSQTPGVKCHTKDLNPHMKEMGLKSTQGASPVPEQGNGSTRAIGQGWCPKCCSVLTRHCYQAFQKLQISSQKPLNPWSYLFQFPETCPGFYTTQPKLKPSTHNKHPSAPVSK